MGAEGQVAAAPAGLSRVDRAIYTVEDQERMSRAENYLAWQSSLVRGELGRRVLELGCGLGNFTGTLLDREAVVAVDIQPECIGRLKQRYAGRNKLHAFVCDVGSPDFLGLARFRLDSCVCLNVLEHIEDDAAALEAMAAVLSPGGVIVLLVPAFQALYGPIDRNLGHYRRYSRGGIRRLAGRAGLRVRKARYSNFAGFFGWWINAHLLKRRAQSERQIHLFDRYLVPVIAPVERVLPPPFGQSLFAVLERP
jgi:SAM-dependent methyltransferase